VRGAATRATPGTWVSGNRLITDAGETPTQGGRPVETILVVDDDDRVRVAVQDMLEMMGYTVLDTGNPRVALRLVEHLTIHLLLTDLVMPLLGGLELAGRVAVLSPQTKVLLMSGSIVSDATARRHPSIAKPFTPDELAERVRQVLAQPAPCR